MIKDTSRKIRRDNANSNKLGQLASDEVRKPRRKPYRRAKSGSFKEAYYMDA